MLHFNMNLPLCALLLIVLATTASTAFGQEESLPIYVRTISGKNLSVNVNPSDTVTDLQEKIKNLAGIPAAQQRLIYSGQQLQEGALLSSYNIQKYDTIHLVLRLRGA